MTTSQLHSSSAVRVPDARAHRAEWWSRVRSAGRFSAADAAARTAVFLALVYAARELGPRAFGEFALVYTAAQITALVADLGLTSLVLRQGARSGRVQRASFWTAIVLNLAASVVCAALLIVAFGVLHGAGVAIAAVYAPTLVLLTITTSLESAAIAGKRPVRAAMSRLAGNACVLGLTIVLLHLRQAPEAVAAAFLAGGVVKLAFIAVATRSLVPGIRVQRRIALPLLRRGAPFYGSAIAAFLYQRVDVLLLGALAGVIAAGEYAAAYRILDGVLLLPVAVVAAFLPSWSARRPHQLRVRGAGTIVLLLGCIGTLAAVELVLARDGLVGLLFGTEYRSSAVILAVLALAVPIFYVDVALVWLAYVARQERRVALLGALALTVNVAVNVALIRAFGGVGAAVATVVTEAAICVAYALILGAHRLEHRRRAFSMLVTTAAYASVLLVTASVCLAAGAHWTVSCAIVGVVGGALLAIVYRRELREPSGALMAPRSAASMVSNLADQEC